jgi:hypothetical protein
MLGAHAPDLNAHARGLYNPIGGERGPVTFPVFKAGDPALRELNGGFDSHTLPPKFQDSCMPMKRKQKFTAAREAKRRARLAAGTPPPARIIQDKRLKPPKHKKRILEEQVP